MTLSESKLDGLNWEERGAGPRQLLIASALQSDGLRTSEVTVHDTRGSGARSDL